MKEDNCYPLPFLAYIYILQLSSSFRVLVAKQHLTNMQDQSCTCVELEWALACLVVLVLLVLLLSLFY